MQHELNLKSGRKKCILKVIQTLHKQKIDSFIS